MMTWEITELTDWIVADVDGDEYYVESGYADDHIVVDTRTGYGARLSKPGYLDCTEWAVFDTQREAAEYLLETYYDAPDSEMSANEREDRHALLGVM
ncbi:MAG: hypothetical protein GY700_06540 [Propionibacteriaceae bacterium]|nr:hypothetical protein [Propionibacteriaceae bacterium]